METTPDNNPAVEQTLAALRSKYGFVPTLLNDFANASPSAFIGYVSLAQVVEKQSALSRSEQVAVMLYASALNGCGYCVGVHAKQAKGAGLSQEDIAALSQGEACASGNFKLITDFIHALWGNRNQLSPDSQKAFEAAGLSKGKQLDIVAIYALKIITNIGHHITHSQLDKQFQ